MKTKWKSLGSLVAAVTTLLVANSAMAATVVYKDTGFIYGTTPTYSSDPFTISDAGTYQAVLVDYDFPQPLGALGLSINDGGSNEVGHMTGGGSFNFDAQPGTYVANLYGVGGGGLQLGLYGLSVELIGSPSPVALPPTVILLASAVGVFGLVARRRQSFMPAGA